jgi:predicted glycosyltransferase
MRILIDILHPAHVHVFRNFYFEMSARGHELMVVARVKDRATELLDAYGIPYSVISRQRRGAGLALEMITRSFRLARVVRRFRPDVMTGIMGPSISVVGRLLRLPAVVFYDTEFAKQTNWFVYRLAHSVCTPDCYQGWAGPRQRTYAGYHELAYLHPVRFTADAEKVRRFGVEPGEPYFVVRFVSWQAIHDVSETGLTLDQKRQLVTLLQGHGRVLISSEAALPPEFNGRRLTGPVEDIHHLLAYAQLVVGESATMSSEAAVLGVPAVFIATTGRGYTSDQQDRYGLVRHFKEQEFESAIETLRDLLTRRPRELGSSARRKLLAEKIDVTEWMISYFESEFEHAASGGTRDTERRIASQ